jgi:hypothetical protein
LGTLKSMSVYGCNSVAKLETKGVAPAALRVKKKKKAKQEIIINLEPVGVPQHNLDQEAAAERERHVKIRNEINESVKKIIEDIDPSRDYLIRVDALASLKKVSVQHRKDIFFEVIKYLFDKLVVCLAGDGMFN